MDNQGYVMSGMSLLLILPAIMLFMVFMDLNNCGIEENTRFMESVKVSNSVKDLKNDLVLIGKQVIKSEAESVVSSGIPLSNSREVIREHLQYKIDQIVLDYEKNNGIDMECNITDVDNSEDPFSVEVKFNIYVARGDVTHLEYVRQDISLIDPKYPIQNPLPFIKCKNYGGAHAVTNRITLGSSLVYYLASRGVDNACAYENSTTALIIKKCPYDPYRMHGSYDCNSLKNCIDNGYFHESNDGSCFLCRLEGKGTCPHYGIETFVIPHSSFNSTVNNSNLTFNTASSSIDHVIFNDTSSNGTYPGKMFIYYSDGLIFFIIYLDNAHRQKYGLPLV